MKAILIVLPLLLSVGCAPAYTWKSYDSLSDRELCTHLGYSAASGNSGEMRELSKEVRTREARKAITIDRATCELEVQFGAMDYAEKVRKAEAIGQAMAAMHEQQMREQEVYNMNKPTTTMCNPMGNSVHCTTF